MNPQRPYILSGPPSRAAVLTRLLRTPHTGKLVLLALAIAVLTFFLLALRAEAGGPPYPIDRKTQDYYSCRYQRQEATSRLCIQFRPHRGTPAFKPKN